MPQQARPAFLAYLVLIGILFFDVLFMGRTLDPSLFVPDARGYEWSTAPKGPPFCNDSGAVVWAFQPWNRLVHRSLLQDGTVPVRNPHQGLGLPLAVNFQSGLFSPLQWPFFLLPVIAWWDWLYVLHLIPAALFTFLFLRRLGLGGTASWLGGAVYCLGGYRIDYINMNHLGVELMAPVCVFFLESWFQKPGGLYWSGFAGALALTVLGGMPEATLLLWIFLAGYTFFRFHRYRFSLKTLLRLGAAFAVGGMTSAVLLVPGIEYLFSAHSKHYVEAWGLRSFTPDVLVGFLNPHFFGPPGSLGWTLL